MPASRCCRPPPSTRCRRRISCASPAASARSRRWRTKRRSPGCGRSAGATWVTSVCTGSLLLGAAGLLRGYRAACHWASRDQLAWFGAEPVAERVVFDRNRVTGGGVTAGIDFALALTAAIRGEDHARFVQLSLEYDPAPPFDSGSPERAAPETLARYHAMVEAHAPGRAEKVKAIAERMTS